MSHCAKAKTPARGRQLGIVRGENRRFVIGRQDGQPTRLDRFTRLPMVAAMEPLGLRRVARRFRQRT